MCAGYANAEDQGVMEAPVPETDRRRSITERLPSGVLTSVFQMLPIERTSLSSPTQLTLYAMRRYSAEDAKQIHVLTVTDPFRTP